MREREIVYKDHVVLIPGEDGESIINKITISVPCVLGESDGEVFLTAEAILMIDETKLKHLPADSIHRIKHELQASRRLLRVIEIELKRISTGWMIRESDEQADIATEQLDKIREHNRLYE